MFINEKINHLRNLMKEKNIDYYLIPHDDENLLESIPMNKERLKWISGFSGSAGSLIVGKNNLNLFVDGRYLVQSKMEMKKVKCTIHNISDFSLLDFIKQIKLLDCKIGIDIKTISINNYNLLKKICHEKNIKIVNIINNLIDILWKRSLKFQKTDELFLLDKKYVGKSFFEKKKQLISYIKGQGAQLIFTQNSESLAWLLNLRGKDLDFTPITFCSALISKSFIYLFLEDKNIPTEIKKKLGNKIKFFNKTEFVNIIKKICVDKKIIIDEFCTSFFNFNLLSKCTKKILIKDDIIQNLKSIKNIQEIKCLKKAHLYDGKALCKFLYWFKNKKGTISELDIVNKVDDLRAENLGFICRSFPTIAGSGPNGAIIHYQPSLNSNRIVKENDILLLDSGAQYFYGTTDVTRTISRGKVTKEQINNYTLVLKGHLKINMAVFPVGITGSYLDSLGRHFLWRKGKDYAHGTGHGVGFCLNVHEGPFSISSKNKQAIANGMVFSNEPGYYKNNSYGIRIENMVTAKSINLNNKDFIKIENLTLVPYEIEMINNKMLDIEEKKWINNYHKYLIKKLSPLLKEKEKVWLVNICKEIK